MDLDPERNAGSSLNRKPHYIGRIAPSPTGAQHLGNARTYLVAWLLAKVHRGNLLLRIEDLDTPRTKNGATEMIFEDLRWLGLNWDATEPTLAQNPFQCIFQSERVARYAELLDQLKNRELVYPCICSRREIEEAASAPHETSGLRPLPIDGSIYPGSCAHRSVGDAAELERQGKQIAWRFRFKSHFSTRSDDRGQRSDCANESGVMKWVDEFSGSQSLCPELELGDFVVARSYGPPAYQLAVVADDHDSGVSHVVRGDDLIYSTYRQIALYESFGWSPPKWFHVPLVIGTDGKRLAKRHGDTRLSTLREHGYSPAEILGYLAWSLDLIPEFRPLPLGELALLVKNDPDLLKRIPHRPVQIELAPPGSRK